MRKDRVFKGASKNLPQCISIVHTSEMKVAAQLWGNSLGLRIPAQGVSMMPYLMESAAG